MGTMEDVTAAGGPWAGNGQGAVDLAYTTDLQGAAIADADAAASASGVVVREIADHAGMEAVCDLFAAIWRYEPSHAPVTSEMLHGLVKAGSYAAAAYLGDLLVAAAVGFLSPPAETCLHSHVVGVTVSARSRSVGFALKLHQRAWALTHGVNTVTWTFDPLVRRNAYFNLGKLAAHVEEYLPDFYGPMHDEINGHDQTDRFLVRWPLTDSAVRAACAGRQRTTDARAQLRAGGGVLLGISADNEPIPAPATADTLLVAVPPDIEQLRKEDPPRAARWRAALRNALVSALADGRQITGFDRSGWYVLAREDA